MKQELKNALLRDYKLAIEGYERQDEITYFRNLRPAIESLCQLVIIDIMDDNEKAAELLIRGTNRRWRNEEVIDSKTTIGSSTYPDIICSLLNIKKIYNQISDSSERVRAKRDIEYACIAIRDAYSLCSNAASHINVKNKLNLQQQIQEQVWRIPNFVDKLKNRGALTKGFVKFIEEQLPMPSISSQEIEKYEEKFNMLQEKIKQLQEANKVLSDAKVLAEQQVGQARQMAEEIVASAKQQMEIFTKKINELTEENEQLQQQIKKSSVQSIITDETALITMPLDTPEETMDDDQLDLIERTLDKSMLVSGCAGSGKSLIAIKKAQQIIQQGGDVLVITYTSSLNDFIDNGIRDHNLKSHVLYYYQWEKKNFPKADYIIVDEVQDFDEDEIRRFINATKKCYFFFGDTAQSIYGGMKHTLSIEEISKITGLTQLPLYNNYRLPRNIAKVTQQYVVNNPDLIYSERVYQNKENVFPYIVHYNNVDEEISAIVKLIKEQKLPNVGILLPNNDQVLQIYKKLIENGIYCEYKYSDEENKKTYNTLNFSTIQPKIMTYHSAKGLQFETVILPSFTFAKGMTEQKTQYVAMTRTYRNLYVMYQTAEMPFYKPIPAHLYKPNL